MNKRKLLIEVLSALLILLFLYACVSRWLDFGVFRGEMNNQPLPNSLTPWLIWIIPSTELLIVMLLMFGRTRLVAFHISLVLMLVFTVYSAAILLNAFGRMPCTCGGIIRKLTWPQNLAFDLFFSLISLLGIILEKKTSSTSSVNYSNV